MNKIDALLAIGIMAAATGSQVRFANAWEQGPRRVGLESFNRTTGGGQMQRHGVKKPRNKKGRR